MIILRNNMKKNNIIVLEFEDNKYTIKFTKNYKFYEKKFSNYQMSMEYYKWIYYSSY